VNWIARSLCPPRLFFAISALTILPFGLVQFKSLQRGSREEHLPEGRGASLPFILVGIRAIVSCLKNDCEHGLGKE
jgi:hypothetical protein